MPSNTHIFDRLVDARTSLVGKASIIKIDAPAAFASKNASGDLRPVDSLDEIGRIAEASGRRLRGRK